MKIGIVLFFCLGLTTLMYGQTNKAWGGKSCAVVLTYDDALDGHLDRVVPSLDSLGFKGTFFLSTFSAGFTRRVEDWRRAALKGHELANHTVFHPCVGNTPGREWVRADYDLSHYSVARMADELRMNNVVLTMVDGQTKRTLAYPCGDMEAGGTSYVDAIKTDFIAARSTKMEIITDVANLDPFKLGCYPVGNDTGEALISQVKEAMKQKGLVVFLFHGVGGGHNINVDLKAHKQLLQFLKQNEKSVEITTFIGVMEQIAQYNSKKPK